MKIDTNVIPGVIRGTLIVTKNRKTNNFFSSQGDRRVSIQVDFTDCDEFQISKKNIHILLHLLNHILYKMYVHKSIMVSNVGLNTVGF